MDTFYYPPKTISKIKQLILSEKQIEDVFQNGSHTKVKGDITSATRKYNGYEIGIYYTKENSKISILTVWKRERR
jgi:hypothetical protein